MILKLPAIFLVKYYLPFESEVKLSNMVLFINSGKVYSNTACDNKFSGELISWLFSYVLVHFAWFCFSDFEFSLYFAIFSRTSKKKVIAVFVEVIKDLNVLF